MKIKMLFYVALLSVLGMNVYAQEKVVANPKKTQDVSTQIDIVATYERVAEKGYKEEKMFRKLGDQYYFKGDFMKASKWYYELFAMNQNQESQYYDRYSRSLKATDGCDIADILLELSNKKQ